MHRLYIGRRIERSLYGVVLDQGGATEQMGELLEIIFRIQA